MPSVTDAISVLMSQVRTDTTLEELLDHYVQFYERRNKPNSIQAKNQVAQAIRRSFSMDRPILEIPAGEWEDFIYDHSSRATRCMAYQVISHMFSVGKRQSMVLLDPTEQIPRPKKPAPRERVPTESEWKRLGAVLLPHSKGVLSEVCYPSMLLLVLIMTGARPHEILQLTQQEVTEDALNKRILRISDVRRDGEVVRTVKTDNRKIYLNQWSLSYLKRLKSENLHDFWLVVSDRHQKPYSNGTYLWDRYGRSRAELPKDLKMYDLRSGFATAGLAAGLTVDEVGLLLGHSDGRVTRRYAYHTDQQAVKLAERVGEEVAELLWGKN